jgi:hypothetical protein
VGGSDIAAGKMLLAVVVPGMLSFRRECREAVSFARHAVQQPDIVRESA